MRISQLRYFVTVAQLENMSQAAELLHLSQSSLSKNISTLEEEHGMPLFQRSGRRVILNAAGERFLEYSTMALRELEYAVDDMELLSSGRESRIRIGTAGYSDRLGECLAAFREIEPQAEFELTGNIETQEHLDINQFDMLIYPDTRKYEKYQGMLLYEERYYLAVPANHRLAESTVAGIKMFEDENVIFLRSGRSGEEYPYHICSVLALRFPSVCFADTRELHCRMISEGLGVGFVPRTSAYLYQKEDIRLIPVLDQRFSRRMMICFRREKYLSELASRFREFVLEYFTVEEKPGETG